MLTNGLKCLQLLVTISYVMVAEIISSKTLELSMGGLHSRSYSNASLGLQSTEDDHQCKWDKHGLRFKGGGYNMTFTANRRPQSETLKDAYMQKLQLAIVLAVGGHGGDHGKYDYGPSGSVNGLMGVWDSWLDNFFSITSNTTSLILLFDERDYRKQSQAKTSSDYLDSIVMHNMGAKLVDCVQMRSSDHKTTHLRRLDPDSEVTDRPYQSRHFPQDCNNFLPLDSGYRLYYIDVAAASNSSLVSQHQQPLIIFAAVHSFPAPLWASNKDEEVLFSTWKPWRLPGRYPTNYAYVKMTNWYSYHMLNLRVLDFFDYGGKLDNDVSFVKEFPESNLPLKLAKKNTKMLVTQKGWYYDDPRVAQGVLQCLETWIKEESKDCGWKSLHPTGRRDPTFWESNLNATFRAHFLVYWFGLYTAPETKRLAKYWNYWHPRGMWDYRWGDQQWWPRPISMFGSGDVSEEIDHYDEINTDNEQYVVHKLWPRAGTIPKGKYFHPNGSTKAYRDRVYKKHSKSFIY